MTMIGFHDETYATGQYENIINEFVFEEDVPKITKIIADAVAASEPINTTFRLKNINGELLWVDVSASMIGDDGKGKVYYAVLSKSSNEAELYRNLVEDASIGTVIIEKDADRKIIYANAAWRNIEGVPASEPIAGVSLKRVLRNQSVFIDDNVLQNTPSDHFLEIRTTSRTGATIAISARSVVWNGVDACVCYIKDDTEKVQKEAAQESLLDNLPCGAGVYKLKDNEMSLVYQNKSYWELVGLNEAAFPDPAAMSAIHPDDVPMVQREIYMAIQQGRAVSCDIRLKHLTLGYRPVHVAGNIVHEGNGEFSIYVTFMPRE